MANFFSGVGQALPQAIGLMTNIQELQERSRHQRALEDFRQQEIGMKEKESALNVDLTKNQIAESQLKQRKGQLELGNMEKEQKELDLPRPVLSLPQIAQMDDEVRKNIIGMMTQFQAAEGDPNMPMTSMRKWNKFSEMIKGDKELFKKAYYPALASVEKMWMSLNEKIAKWKMEGKDVSAELEKAEVLRQRYVQMAAAYQGKMTDLEKTQNLTDADYLALPETDPRRSSYIKGKQEVTKPDKPPSLGNAAETAIVMKFGSRDYLTDPKKSAQADAWIGTKEGQEYLARATSLLTPPSVSFQQTAEGITPGITRGPGAGTLGTPTGVGKPVPPGEVTKIGDLNTLARNISEAEKLYNPEWVGPVMGRVGGVREKYTGGASEEQVKFYAYVRDMKDALLRARSGAQINEQEYARLVKFLPDENSPAKTFEARLARFKEAVGIILEEKKRSLSEGGYGKSVGKTKKPLSAFEGR